MCQEVSVLSKVVCHKVSNSMEISLFTQPVMCLYMNVDVCDKVSSTYYGNHSHCSGIGMLQAIHHGPVYAS